MEIQSGHSELSVISLLLVAGPSAAVVSVDLPGGNRRPGEPRPV